MRLWNAGTKNSGVVSRELHASEFIPYLRHWNRDSMILKNGCLMKVISVSGFAFETADDEDLEAQNSIRNQIIRSISSPDYALYFHTIRRKKNAFSEGFAGSDFANVFTDYVNSCWVKKHSSRLTYINELYLTVIRKNANSKVARLASIWNNIGGSSNAIFEEELKNAYEELTEVVNRVTTSLRNYSPVVLGIEKSKSGPLSEIAEFLSKIVNCITDSKSAFPLSRVDQFLPTHRLFFGRKTFQVLKSEGSEYGAIVSVKEYGQQTSPGMLDAFLQLPYEFIITQSFSFTARQAAITKMQIQQNRMLQSADKAVSQVVEISQALDDAMSGRIAFGTHHLTITCFEKSIKRLDNAISMIETELSSCGVYPVRESINMEAAFWSQLPGNFDFVVRKAILSSLNISGFASLHNYPVGRKFNNHWGEALTVLDTTSGTPFFFNFHLRDVGHTTIIGPTGSGKTVLMNFLCAQLTKFAPRMFFFDKDRGAEIFLRASGGLYSVIETRKSTGFNPLQLDDTPSNRAFLFEWLKSLLTVYEQSFTARDMTMVNNAIEGNFKLRKEDRILRNLVPFFGLTGKSDSLADRISIWHGNGSHSSIFDNEKDEIDFRLSSIFGFEMGKVLQDTISLGPVLLYLFHRINLSLDGTPTAIILDEAWALIDNPVFAPKIKDWLKVLRKLNTFVVFATQSVEDASKSAISDTLIQQTATQIFLPNLKATSAYRDVFMLTEREYTLIKHTDPGTRFFLIKQGVDAVVARLNLRGLENMVNVLSGRSETVLLLHEILQEVGHNPEDWLPVFYDRVKDV